MPNTRRQQPDPRRSPTPYAMSLRLTDAQYRGLLLLAEAHEKSMGACARQLLDAALDAIAMTGGPHAGKSMRQALEDDPSLTGYPETSDAPAQP